MLFHQLRISKRITVFDVSNFFLSQRCPNEKLNINLHKLHKLVYYAQAWSLALRDKSLFQEAIEAWERGPVCPALHRKYNGYGFTDISPIPKNQQNESKFTDEEQQMLNDLWKIYGCLSEGELAGMVHSEDPWKNAYESPKKKGFFHEIITDESMQTYYKTRIVKPQP